MIQMSSATVEAYAFPNVRIAYALRLEVVKVFCFFMKINFFNFFLWKYWLKTLFFMGGLIITSVKIPRLEVFLLIMKRWFYKNK
jgi:hypothetical protein